MTGKELMDYKYFLYIRERPKEQLPIQLHHDTAIL